jgi:hypothetical protein
MQDQAVEPRPPSTPQERSKVFQWFTDLGYRDVKDLKFVRVATGRSYSSFVGGFLLWEKGESFTVLTIDLEERQYQKTPVDTEPSEKIDFEIRNLKDEAAACLKTLRSPTPQDRDQLWLLDSLHMFWRTQTFILAWACHRNELDDLAADLFDHAAKMGPGFWLNSLPPAKEPLQETVAADLARNEMRKAVDAFGDTTITRTQLLKRFERIHKEFPASEYGQDAKAYADTLTKMIKEDADLDKAAMPFDRLSKEEQIAELIFQLRNQSAGNTHALGWRDIFNTPADSPANRLVKIGYDAVPQLIEHFNDDRFVRWVNYSRHGGLGLVQRVHDCTVTILEHLASRHFRTEAFHFNGKISPDRQPEGTITLARRWYADLKAKGEKQVLIEAVGWGDSDSDRSAGPLVEKYPADAFPALIAGIKAAKDPHVRTSLLITVAALKNDPGVAFFLLREAKAGPNPKDRALAVQALQEMGRPEALAITLARWEGKRINPQVAAVPARKNEEDNPDDLSRVAEFLAASGKLDAIIALAKDLRKRPIALRLCVVSCFAAVEPNSVSSEGWDPLPFRGHGQPSTFTKEVRHAIEKLLVGELDDKAERIKLSGMWLGNKFRDPRVCDIAGQVLQQLMPDKYEFDMFVPLAERDRGLVSLGNVWLKSQGLPLVPAPVRKKIDPAPPGVLEPLLAKLLQAPAAERTKVEVQIEQLGLSALPGTLAMLEKTDIGDGRSILRRLTSRLATVVEDVTFGDESLKPNATLAAKLTAMKGKAFDPDAFLIMMQWSMKNKSNETQALCFAVDRACDGTGVTIKVELFDKDHAKLLGRSGTNTPNKNAPRDAPESWTIAMSIRAGEKDFLMIGGAGAGLLLHERDDHPLAHALKDACLSAPNESLAARFEMIADRRNEQRGTRTISVNYSN